MCGRLLEQRGAITAGLSDRMTTKMQDARTLEMRDEHWHIMAEIAAVLETLKGATTVTSAEKYMSISNIYPIIFSLRNTHLMRAEEDDFRGAELKAKVRQCLSVRMGVGRYYYYYYY